MGSISSYYPPSECEWHIWDECRKKGVDYVYVGIGELEDYYTSTICYWMKKSDYEKFCSGEYIFKVKFVEKLGKCLFTYNKAGEKIPGVFLNGGDFDINYLCGLRRKREAKQSAQAKARKESKGRKACGWCSHRSVHLSRYGACYKSNFWVFVEEGDKACGEFKEGE